MNPLYKLIYIVILIAAFNISGTAAVNANNNSDSNATIAGYSVLKIFLEDEQYLTTIRRTKMIISFSDVSDSSRELIDSIANTSEKALEELDEHAKRKPQIVFKDFSDEMIAIATLDSLRMSTAKEFLFESDDFEKNLLLSQLKVLPLISHLSEQLEAKETNESRRLWLNKLARRFEDYYQQVNASISLSVKNKKS